MNESIVKEILDVNLLMKKVADRQAEVKEILSLGGVWPTWEKVTAEALEWMVEAQHGRFTGHPITDKVA